MINSSIWIGDTPAHKADAVVDGQFVTVKGEAFYRITHFDQMPPFFMSIVSDSDHWMFVSSLGGISAGRKNPDYALFPYVTVDKIHDAVDHTGSKTILLVQRNGRDYLWEPFSKRYAAVYNCKMSLYKSVYGDKVCFESINDTLGIRFCYTWNTSEKYGFIKQSEIENLDDKPVSVRILDGIQNLLHFGIERGLQSERSNLLDAYKKNELDAESGLGIYALSSLVVDKPIPSEALKATTVWCSGVTPSNYLVSSRQLDRFRKTGHVETEIDIRAERGAYFVQVDLNLDRDSTESWYLVAEINQGPGDVISLTEDLKNKKDLHAQIGTDIQAGTEQLKTLVGSADGMQCTADAMTTTRHYSNVLFNIMRGGVFDNNTRIDRDDLRAVIKHFNAEVYKRHASYLDSLPAQCEVGQLLRDVSEKDDRQLERLCYEYLPLIFSRRHGDPSRPWNMFSIDLRDEQGDLQRSYQGNWRDIFQNWEALCLSFPAFTEGIISKFVNASTIDGYNPYRITREGIDWEIMDPDDPWSYIGYWGDHQTIYLLKLLEVSRSHHPDHLTSLLTREIFAYANVPYRIKPYEELIKDPHNTILYDESEERLINDRVSNIGADGKLVLNKTGQVYLVNLTEKLLVSVLAKLSNFIPGAGIWMNTQRPEWNDANNALVGYGVSMVTLYYLRRFNRFMADLFGGIEELDIQLSEEVEFFLVSISDAFLQYRPFLERRVNDYQRKEIVDALGEAASAYRMLVYHRGFTGKKKTVSSTELARFFELTLEGIDQTIWENQREDNLFHAYNLMKVTEKGVSVSNLYEMLEGQVAVLSAGVLSASQTVDVLVALKQSALYREDQNSYILYPDRKLARFTEKNVIPEESVLKSDLLVKLVKDGNSTLIVVDQLGGYHFNGSIKDREVVDEILSSLANAGYGAEVEKEREAVQNLYSTIFGHTEYTGRSGTFFGYEGLGCIYWHMVSKLVLAIKESYYTFYDRGTDRETMGRLVEAYYDVRAGIGLNKTPDIYGAFPFDPYSHTPGHVGARQPGMTGQVKEDIISRWGELGVVIQDGCMCFLPVLLRGEEFLNEPDALVYTDLQGSTQSIQLEAGSLAFTYCQVPFIYAKNDDPKIMLTFADGKTTFMHGLKLNEEESNKILNRTGEIVRVRVELMPVL